MITMTWAKTSPKHDDFDLALIQLSIVEWLMENGEAHPDSNSANDEAQQYGCLVGTKGGFTYTHAPTWLPHAYGVRGHNSRDLMHIGVTHVTSTGGAVWWTYTNAPDIIVPSEGFRRGLWMENVLGYDLSKYLLRR